MCDHYKLHMKALRGSLTPDQRHQVDTCFHGRLAELLVEKRQQDSGVGSQEAAVIPDDNGSPEVQGFVSGDEEGGEEEEDDDDAGDEEGSEDEDASDGDDDEDASDSSDVKDDSDGAGDKNVPDGAGDQNAAEVGDDRPSTSAHGRLILRIRKALHPMVYNIPKPLKFDESSYERVSRGRRAKRGATLRELSASGSDMELEGSPGGSKAIVAGPSTEEERLMKESLDQQSVAVDDGMLPDRVRSRPGGNRYSLSVRLLINWYSQEVGSWDTVRGCSLLKVSLGAIA